MLFSFLVMGLVCKYRTTISPAKKNRTCVRICAANYIHKYYVVVARKYCCKSNNNNQRNHLHHRGHVDWCNNVAWITLLDARISTVERKKGLLQNNDYLEEAMWCNDK